MDGSFGPVEIAGGARVRCIPFAADGGAPAALRRLAALIEAERVPLQNLWLGAPVAAGAEVLVFVTLHPAAPSGVASTLPPPPPSELAATVDVPADSELVGAHAG